MDDIGALMLFEPPWPQGLRKAGKACWLLRGTTMDGGLPHIAEAQAGVPTPAREGPHLGEHSDVHGLQSEELQVVRVRRVHAEQGAACFEFRLSVSVRAPNV